MRLENLRLKLKGIRLRRFCIGNGRRKSSRKQLADNGQRDHSWMKHVSHGYHVVELDHKTWTSNIKGFDSDVVVQREQIKECDFWFFGVFDDGIGDGVTKYMQSHFFDKMPEESRMGKKCMEIMKRAHLNSRTKLIDDKGSQEGVAGKSGAALAVVINGEKLVMSNKGGYEAVICRNGDAYRICRKKQQLTTIKKWPLKFLSGALRVPKLHKIGGDSSTVAVGSEGIDSETEFVILASNGVWEVMKHREAVNLIRHIEDPHAAAECLATEALIRMSKSKISCLVIRFD